MAWGPTSVVFGYGAYNSVVSVAANIAVAVVLSLVLPKTPGEVVPSDFEDAPRAG